MSAQALVLAYHGIEPGPAPLFIEPALFEAHLEVIAESGVRAVSLDQLARELSAGGPDQPSVAISFDDGFASVAEQAAPLLLERGIPATVFCVAGHLGGVNDFDTDPAAIPKRRLASAGALAALAAEGFELGSHGMAHAPLALADDDQALLEREIVDSKRVLEDRTGHRVGWFSYPYASVPGPRGRALIKRSYAGACAHGLRAATPGADRYALPRVDAHYLRRPGLLRRALQGDGTYLGLRRLGARARRALRQDFASDPV